ncbi:MAG TPA: phosphatidylinositol-specific phospholipase C/glycerophosphodiester phosphodiesterase family protein [Chitinophagales bacterium]|nr:phosphatidylinositol-specific phospholipase C/glycerophosphodiester phosphodiesterase family protein [Chitinophagales bacterium]
MNKHLLVFCLTFVSAFWLTVVAQQPLPNAHAHNDYVHKRPLAEALENGFTSIEVDVFLYNGELKVAHVPLGLAKKKTIQQLYLDPLRRIVANNGGRVYSGYSVPVILMVDFKTAGPETYLKLKEVLAGYRDILTVYQHDSVIEQKAVNVLISGSAPVVELLKEDTALATVDADLRSMGDTLQAKVVTRYSSGWGAYFTWKGKGKMPEAQQQKLNALVAQAHRMGKHIRLYHIPDKPAVWLTLTEAGVDWINTDKLSAYSAFCKKSK